MKPFHLIYSDDAVSLAFIVATFYIVGGNMADETVRRWGWRAAALAYVLFVVYACSTVPLLGARDLAYIAFRGLFAGGLTVGVTWMGLAIVLFVVRELKELEVPEPAPAATPQKEEQDERERR